MLVKSGLTTFVTTAWTETSHALSSCCASHCQAVRLQTHSLACPAVTEPLGHQHSLPAANSHACLKPSPPPTRSEATVTVCLRRLWCAFGRFLIGHFSYWDWKAYPSGRAVYGVGLQPLYWYMIYLFIYLFNRSWVDTRWQQYITHLHTNSTHNTEKGKLVSAGRAPFLRVIPWHLPYNWGKSTGKPQLG
jgi:hypothetical protein